MTTRSESFLASDGVELRLTARRFGHDQAILVTPGIFMHRESPEHRRLADGLADVADILTLDVRGHGDSGGRFTWGHKEPGDLIAVARWMRESYRRVGGLGFSYGGYSTVMAAASGPVFDAVALVAAPKSLFIIDHNPFIRGLSRSVPLMLRRERRFTRLMLGLPPRRVSPLRVIGRIAPPLLIIHGSEDWLIPLKHALELYDRAAEPKELEIIPGGLHAENIVADNADSLIEPLRQFFVRVLASR